MTDTARPPPDPTTLRQRITLAVLAACAHVVLFVAGRSIDRLERSRPDPDARD